MQIGQFGGEIPRLKEEGTEYVNRLQENISGRLGITYKDQLKWFQQWGQRGIETLNQTLR
jgi:hypothetical protein